MNEFKEWLWEDEFKSLVRDLFDCCVIKNTNEALRMAMPSDAKKAKERLVNHLRNHFGQGKAVVIKAPAIVSGIRHIFTNYDQEWKAFEKMKTNSDDPVPVRFIHPITHDQQEFDLGDPCDHVSYWNTLVTATADLVKHIVERMEMKPQHVPSYLKANQEWLNSKLIRQHPNC